MKEAITSKWVTDEVFNEVIQKYIPEQSSILDYGCGLGWALFEIANTILLEKGKDGILRGNKIDDN